MIAAIHQPNFFPWLGYFDKIRRADIFIFLDDVQLPKTGGGWSNRTQISSRGESKWLTVPLDRTYSGVRAINETQFSHAYDWRKRHIEAIHSAYAKTPFFDEGLSLVVPLLSKEANNLAAYNSHAVITLSEALGLSVDKFVLSSSLHVEGVATNRLVALTQAVGADTYLSGGGASGYQQDDLFEASGIQLTYQDFRSPIYPQHGDTDFLPGLSIIDALMNWGQVALSDWINASTLSQEDLRLSSRERPKR